MMDEASLFIYLNNQHIVIENTLDFQRQDTCFKSFLNFEIESFENFLDKKFNFIQNFQKKTLTWYYAIQTSVS